MWLRDIITPDTSLRFLSSRNRRAAKWPPSSISQTCRRWNSGLRPVRNKARLWSRSRLSTL